MFLPAFPSPLICQKDDILAAAFGALNTVWPAFPSQIFQAIVEVGEIDDCVLESLRFVDTNGVFHALIITG
jgi:hypothetical protein